MVDTIASRKKFDKEDTVEKYKRSVTKKETFEFTEQNKGGGVLEFKKDENIEPLRKIFSQTALCDIENMPRIQ